MTAEEEHEAAAPLAAVHPLQCCRLAVQPPCCTSVHLCTESAGLAPSILGLELVLAALHVACAEGCTSPSELRNVLVLVQLNCGSCRYAFPTVQLFREIREELIWADGGAVKKATDAAILAVLGPKTDADQQAGKKKPAKKVSRYSRVCVHDQLAIWGDRLYCSADPAGRIRQLTVHCGVCCPTIPSAEPSSLANSHIWKKVPIQNIALACLHTVYIAWHLRQALSKHMVIDIL